MKDLQPQGKNAEAKTMKVAWRPVPAGTHPVLWHSFRSNPEMVSTWTEPRSKSHARGPPHWEERSVRSGWRMQDQEQAGPASEPCWMVHLLGQSSLWSSMLGGAMLLPQTSLVPGHTLPMALQELRGCGFCSAALAPATVHRQLLRATPQCWVLFLESCVSSWLAPCFLEGLLH